MDSTLMHVNDLPRHLDLTSTLTGLNSNEGLLLTSKCERPNHLFEATSQSEFCFSLI